MMNVCWLLAQSQLAILGRRHEPLETLHHGLEMSAKSASPNGSITGNASSTSMLGYLHRNLQIVLTMDHHRTPRSQFSVLPVVLANRYLSYSS